MAILMWKQYVKKDFDYLIELIADNKIKPAIDKRYKLRDTAKGLKYLMDGHAKGKVIITMTE